MYLFGNKPTLRMPEGDGDFGGAGVSAALKAEIGRQLNGWLKREGQQTISEAIASAFQEQMPTLQESLLQQTRQTRSSEGELTEEEWQQALDAGYDPQTDTFYTQDGIPYDPQTGMMYDPETGSELVQDPRTGEIFYADEGMEQEMGADPATNAQLFELRRNNQLLQQQLDELTGRYEQAETQAETADREAQISRLLNSVPFVNDKAAAQFRQYVTQNVWRLDDGTLVAGDEKNPLPLDKFVESEVQGSPHMVASRNLGGSGAFAKPGMRPTLPTMDQIKPFQPREEREALIKQTVEAYQGAIAGQTGTL